MLPQTPCIAGLTAIFCLTLLGTADAAPWLPPVSSSTITNTSTVSPPPPREQASAPRSSKSRDAMSLDEVLEGADQTGTPSRPAPDVELAETSAPPGEDRPMPSYDGREPESANAGEVLIWVPRVIFFPVHLVFEYIIRWPIVATITALEEYYILKRVERFFTWRDGKSGVYPTFFADFGLRPAVGLTTFHRDVFVKGNTFNASFGTWGPKWIQITAKNETAVLDEDTGVLRLAGGWATRPDQPFYGIGPNTSTDDEVNYRWRRWGFGARFLASLGGLSHIGFGTEFRRAEFLLDGEGPAIDPVVAATIPGFDVGGYEIVESTFNLKIDSRDPDPEFNGGTGYRLELTGAFAFDFTEFSRNYVRWGAEAAGFYDFTGRGHVVALRLHTEFVEDTGGTPIPFTELATLGGLETMRGYLQGRFLGDSAIMGTFSYRYPVWSMIDAEVFASVGNVFDGHLRDFSPKKLYLSTGMGLRTSIARDTAITFLVAVGTKRFDSDDFKVDSVRIVFGLQQGF